jgi:pyroglutamyl-peptidase
MIAADAPAELALPAPAQRLLAAARETGVPIATSRNAGSYLCNYLCWRAAEAARSGMPRLATFVHVPAVPRSPAAHSSRTSLSLNDLIKAGEAIVQAATAATR